MASVINQFRLSLRSIAVMLAALGLHASIPAARAEVVGTAIVNGRAVLIDSNGTWKYKDQVTSGADDGCDMVSTIKVCLRNADWQRNSQPSPPFKELYGNGGKYYLGVIIEPIGQKAGITQQALQAVIIQYAAKASGVKEAEVPVFDTQTEIKDRPGLRSLTYLATVKGTPVLYRNFFKIYPDQTVQFAFWTIGKEVTPEFTQAVDKALSKITFE